MPPSLVQVETDAQGLRVLTIFLPDRPVNVLSPELRRELIAAVDAALADSSVRGLVITARGPAFVAGADLTVLGGLRGRSVAEVRAFSTPFRTMLRRMEQGGKPVVAAINGTALGGGLELCLACHRRLMADREGAQVGLPEATLGLLPGAGGTQRLGRLIGIEASLPLLLEGRRLSTAAALAAGLVDAVVPPEALLCAARDWLATAPTPHQPWDRPGHTPPGGGPDTAANRALLDQTAARIAEGPGRNDPAPAAILACLAEGLARPMEDGLEIEGQRFAELARGDVAQNRIRAFFAMGAARKAARVPASAAVEAPTQLLILGDGPTGRALADLAARRGLAVASRDPTDATVCDLLLAVVEETDRAILRDALAAAGPAVPGLLVDARASLATLTATLPAPNRFVGLRFSAPLTRWPLVEVTSTPQADAAVLARALDLARRLGRTAIRAGDDAGGFARRVQAAGAAEGLVLLAEGVPADRIAAAARQAELAMDPFALAGALGAETLRALCPEDAAETVAAMLDRMTAAGRPGLAAAEGPFPATGPAPASEALRTRLLWAQAMAAARAWAEGVIDDPRLGDVASLTGWGFPGWTGGVMSLLDQGGLAPGLAIADRLAATHGPRFAPPHRLRAEAAASGTLYP